MTSNDCLTLDVRGEGWHPTKSPGQVDPTGARSEANPCLRGPDEGPHRRRLVTGVDGRSAI
jgi:hypothetical protein